MTKLIDELNREIDELSLLKHDFYKMWQDGKLTKEHLAGYSKEYFQLVKIVPKMVENVLKNSNDNKYDKLIMANLEDEREHVRPWVDFASSLNVSHGDLLDYEGTDLTKQSVKDLCDLSESSFEEGVAALYAFEKELPRISETKLDGLKRFYGLEDKKSCEYFDIHSEVDIYHSKIWENILNDFDSSKAEKILNAAKVSLKAQNGLLDSVKNEYVDKSIAC
jgi:pyrroloquinoline-quinone synthase